MNDPISVGLGEVVVSKNPQDVLVAYGLGSCVAVAMVDPATGACGLLHAVLPEGKPGAPAPKYVDSGIEGLIQQMERLGADRRRLVIRMVGGANMLQNASLSVNLDIGARNVQSARRTFERMNLRLRSEEVGGNTGRTVRLYVEDGKLTVRSAGGKEEAMM